MYPSEFARRAFVFLDTRRFTFLVRGRFKAVNRELLVAELLQLAFCDWMSHIESLGDGSVQDRILDHFGEEFWHDFEMTLLQQPRGQWPAVTAAFAGGQRYVLLEGRRQWYDIYEGQLLEELPKPPITMILCDLTALCCETMDRLANLGLADAKSKRDAATEGGAGQGVG